MKNNNETYIAQFTCSKKISEDRWEVSYPTLHINPNTKVSEIIEWYENTHGEKRIGERFHILLVRKI